MVEFNGNYVSASDVSYVTAGRSGRLEYPHNLTVRLKNGQSLGVDYATEASRNRDREKLIRQIDSELRRDSEKIQSQLFVLQDTIRRIDKRQLRIWRQLKALLDLNDKAAEDVEETT